MSESIKDLPMVMVLLSYFFRPGLRTYRQSRDNKKFLDRRVAKFSKLWGSSCMQDRRYNEIHSLPTQELLLGFLYLLLFFD